MVADSSMYAHFLFEAFDTNKNGTVSFEVRTVLPFLEFANFLPKSDH